MAATVNIGTLEGLLRWKADDTELNKSLDTVAKKAEVSKSQLSKYNRELSGIDSAYKRVAASLDPTIARTQRYDKSVEALNRALKANLITQAQHNTLLGKAQTQLQGAEHWTARLGRSISGELTSSFMRFFAVTAIISTVGAGIISVSKQLIAASIENEAVQHKVEAAVNRLGDTSDITAEQINKLADSQSRLTGIDDEQIAESLAEVSSKYNRLSSEILPALTQASLDAAAATGEDLSAAFDKNAKMANQPLRALTLLGREGYAVGASQADLVKHLLRTNDLAGAQEVIVEILQSRYIGAAADIRDTMGGALQALGTSWENLLEKMGEDHTGPIRDTIEKIIKLLDWLTDQIDAVGVSWNNLMIDVLTVKIVGQKIGFLGVDDGTELADLERQLKEREIAVAKSTARMLISQGKMSEEWAKKIGLIDVVTKKNVRGVTELTEAERKLNDELRRQVEAASKAAIAVEESIGKLLDQALDASAVYTAATKGLKEYNDELLNQKVQKAIDAEEARLKAVSKTLTLTVQQRKEIETAIRATDEFGKKTKEVLDKWTALERALSGISGSIQDIEIDIKLPATVSTMTIETDLEDSLEEWNDFGKSIHDGLKSAAELADEHMKDVAKAVEKGTLSAVDAEEHLARIREQLLADTVSAWGSLLSQAGGLFGSDSISQAGNLINSFGGAVQASNNAQAEGTALAMASSVLAWAALFKAIADILTKKGGDLILTLNSAGTSIGVISEISGRTPELAGIVESYLDLVRRLVESIGGVAGSLGQSQVVISEGRAWVRLFEGGIREFGEDIQAALEFAAIEAIQHGQFTALSPSVRRVIETSMATRLNDFLSDINFARELDALGSVDPGIARSIQQLVQGFMENFARAFRLGLDAENLISALGLDFTALRNQILGISESIEERIRRQSEAFNIERALTYAQAQLQLVELQGKERQIRADLELVRIELGLGAARLTGRERLLEAEAGLAQAEIEMVNAMLDALASIQSSIAAIQGVLANLPEIISNQEIDDAIRRARGAGGGGGTSRASVRDFITTRTFELDISVLSTYEQALAQLNKQYDDLLKQAGKDNALRAQLIALRGREIELLEREKIASTVESFQSFLGLDTGFDNVRKTAAGLIKEIEDSPFGDARKARMIGRVMDELDKQIEKMSQEMAVGLFGEMLADLEKFGATEELQSSVRQAIALIEHTLAMENYRTRIEILRAEGNISAEVMAKLDEAFRFLEGIDPLSVFGPPAAPPTTGGPPPGYEWNGYDWVPAGQAEAENPFARAMELLNEYMSEGADAFTEARQEIVDNFEFIISILGETPEVMQEYGEALERLNDQYLSSLQDFYDSLRTGPDSNQTVDQQYESAMGNFFSLLNDDIDNVSQADEITAAGEMWRDLAAQMFGTSTGGFEWVIAQLEAALGPILGIDTPSANVLAGPAEWFAQSSSDITSTLADTSQLQIGATQDVARVIDFRAGRSESLQRDTNQLLLTLINRVESLENTVQSQYPPSTSYGNG